MENVTMDIIRQDMQMIFANINPKRFYNKSILITGGSGLIGNYFLNFFEHLNEFHHSNIQIYNVSKHKRVVKKNTNLNSIFFV